MCFTYDTCGKNDFYELKKHFKVTLPPGNPEIFHQTLLNFLNAILLSIGNLPTWASMINSNYSINNWPKKNMKAFA